MFASPVLAESLRLLNLKSARDLLLANSSGRAKHLARDGLSLCYVI